MGTIRFCNLGKVTNKGIEITLNTQNIVKGDFRWSTDFVFTKNKEKIADIDGSGNSNFANLWILGNRCRLLGIPERASSSMRIPFPVKESHLLLAESR
jgi:hypothetical protein